MLYPITDLTQPPAVTQQKPAPETAAPKATDGLTPAQIEVLLKGVPVFSLTDAGPGCNQRRDGYFHVARYGWSSISTDKN